MAVTEQATTALIGVFGDRKEAERFVEELKRAGFRDDQIGVATRHEETPAIEKAENRELFKSTMTAVGLPTLPSSICEHLDEAKEALKAKYRELCKSPSKAKVEQ